MSDGNVTTAPESTKPAAAAPAPTNDANKAAPAKSTASDISSAFDGDAGAEGGVAAKPVGGEAKPGDEKKPAAAPVELKLPEGVEYDAAELDALKKLATDTGLTSEAAQKLLEFDIAREGARNKAAQAKLDAQTEAWAQQVMADKELGGEKWAETKADIARARTYFGAPVANAQKFFAHMGLSTHPVVVRLFADLGKAAREDTVKGALTPAAKPPTKSDAEIF